MMDATRDTDSGWFGHRRIALAPGVGRLTLSDGVRVEWKDGDVPAGAPGGVTARAALADGFDTVEIDIPPATGWCRLALDLPPTEPNRMTGLRVLMRMAPRGHQGPGSAQNVVIGHAKADWFNPIETSMARISYAADTWHEVTGAFLPATGDQDAEATYGIVLNLPEDHRVTLALVDIGQMAVTRAATAGPKLTLIAPFRARPLTPGAARRLAAAPPVFAADARLEGFRVSGWVFAGTDPDAAAITVRQGDMPPCPAETGLMATIASGITAPCGFEADVAPLCAASTALTCHLEARGGSERSFVTLSRRAGIGDTRGSEPRLFSAPPEPADPYQSLVARALEQATAKPGGLKAACAALEDPAHQGQPVILHLTSLTGFLRHAPDRATAQRLADDLARQLRFFVHQGGRLIWALRSPPKGRWPQIERQLGQQVADLGGPIHLHSDRLTGPLTAAWGITPAKDRLVIVPLGGTVGQYTDYLPREAARARLGLPDDAPLFLIFGRLGPSKGIETAVAAFDRLRETEPKAHLLIVGRPETSVEGGRLRRWLAGRPHVEVIEGQPADTSLQWHLRAADWALMPYEDARTPEALATMMSFGLPAIAPTRGMIPEIVSPDAGLVYDPDSPGALVETLRQAATMTAETRDAMGVAARAAMAARDWSAAARALETPAPAPRVRPVTLRFEDGPLTALLMGKPLPDDSPSRTAIVILNYDNCDDSARLIASLRAGTDTDFDIFLVDNASPSVTPEELRQRFDGCHIVALPRNLGYAAGNNAALQLIREIGHRYILILNPDLVAPAGALADLVTGAEAHGQPAVFAPALLRGGGSGRVASAGCFLDTARGLATGHMYSGVPEADLPTAPFEADFVTGAAMFLSHETLRRIGPIPEAYFLYFEESDWLTAAAREGVPSIVLPQVRLEHHKRSEDGHVPARHYFYYYIRNMHIFARALTARGRDPDMEATLARLKDRFIDAWMTRIWRDAPDLLPRFRALADQALADGAAGRTGPVDLIADTLTGDDPALPNVDAMIAGGLRLRLDATDPAQPRLKGTLALPLGVPAAGPWQIDVLRGGQVIASARAEAPKFASSSSAPVDIALPTGRARTGQAQSYDLFLNGRKTGSVSAYLANNMPDCTGAITGLDDDGVTGWLRPETPAAGPLEVEILCDGSVVARGPADLPEDGLGMGFVLPLPRALADGTERTFTLRLAGQDTPLAEARLAHLAGDPALLSRDAAEIGRLLARCHEIRLGPDGPGAASLTRIDLSAPPVIPEPLPVAIVMPVMTDAALDGAPASWASVEAQTHPDWTLCLVPATPALARATQARVDRLGDARITCLTSPLPATTAAARIAGIAATDAPVIAHLDPGVIWHPQFLTRMLAQVNETTPAALAAEWLTQAVPEGDGTRAEIIAIRGGQQSLARLENRPVGALSALVTTRAVLDAIGGFDAGLAAFEGWDVMVRLARLGHMPRAVVQPLVTGPSDPPAAARFADPRHALAYKRIGDRIDRLAGGYGGPVPVSQPRRPTDIALLVPPGPGAASALARRLIETLSPLAEQDVRGLAVVPSRIGPALRSALAASDLSCTVIDVETDTVSPETAAHTMLTAALDWRRAAADLLLIRPETLVQGGALAAMAEAAATRPDAGVIVPRHGLRGDSDAARVHAPTSWPGRDICIVISALRDTLEDPALDPDRGLATLTAPDPFCQCLLPEVAEALAKALATAPAAPLEALLTDLVARVCHDAGRQIVYSGRARAFELPL